jgi:tetratricopeptide (TPR) repeat protein
MRYASIVAGLVLIFAACSGDDQPADDIGLAAGSVAVEVTDASGTPLGTVVLTQSCSDDAVVHLGRGMALLHSMTYEAARAEFASAVGTDGECSMGYWGQAMTYVHPLWSDPPSQQDFDRARGLLDKARASAEGDHEMAYVDALDAYFAAGRGDSEKPNLVGFENGWRAFHEKYPNDPEATAFYSLAQLSTVDPGDKTFAKQKAAGSMAEGLLRQIPMHPGAHHYVIHAYDNPALAELAVEVARSYGNVAPEIPHALHMPTHTFTRRGLWEESIDWNRRSADAALNFPVGDQISLHYFHALDYLAYAFLQTAEDKKAMEVMEEMNNVRPPYQPHVASAYTFAAVPARLALERHKWADAAGLEPRQPSAYPWETAPAMEAITYFARALGAARSGRFEQARDDLAVLTAFQQKVAAGNAYWGTQVEIQRLSALAWLKFEEGDRQQGLTTMRAAAELEASTEKHPVTPGEVLPARELLGDMLVELERPGEALAEYEAALDRSPNRFNSLYGAGRAAELSGDENTAQRYYRALLEVTANADTERKRLKHAKEYVG